MKEKNKFNRIKDLIQSFFKSLPMLLTSKNSKKYFGDVKSQDWFCLSKPINTSEKPLITWIGHSSFLVQLGGKNILLDPIFEDLMFLYRRNFPPGISLDSLPKIDYILISHNHSDHLHHKTLLKLKKHASIILVPKGSRAWFDKNNFLNVYESEWWQSHNIDGNLKFDFLPAIHWAGQSLYDINKSIWGSWMISFNGINIYFAGDTAQGSHFKEISEKYKSIDVALMPVSPCNPREFVKESHLDAHEAVRAFIDLNAKIFIPMHWGTFRINLDKFDEPIQLLKKSWNSLGNSLVNKNLQVLKFGQQLKL